jgi:hypothetical protein
MAGNGYVHVACRLPAGVTLRVYEFVDSTEQTPGGPRPVRVSRPILKDGKPWEYTLKGYNPGFGHMPPNFIVVPKWATTRVPKEWWDLVCEQYKDSDMIRNKVIFAASTEPDLAAMVKEAESGGAQSGLEPLNETNDARIARGRLPLTRADEMPPPMPVR